jgi:IS30 family transposase
MAKRRWRRLTVVDRQEIYRFAALGLSMNQLGERVDRSATLCKYVLEPLGGVIPASMYEQRPGHRLSYEDRVEIYIGLREGRSFTSIAASIGFDVSTVSREVGGRAGRDSYNPHRAHEVAFNQARRPQCRKLAQHDRLCKAVIAGLEAWSSPEQIAQRLRADHPDDETMHVSHETIYKSIYVQGRGELRRELATCLRTGRAQRQPRSRLERRGRIPDMVSISERPAEANDRAVPGHWEGDLIIGAGSRSAIGTLVERSTRYVILLHLPARHGALEVREALAAAICRLPEHLRKTITWDQGIEMAQHVQFSIDSGVDVYFCDPHAPWQRGSNENTNGLLRQYFPKSTDLSVHTEQDLQAAADSLNGRPRKTLGWATPQEALQRLLAITA